MNNLIEEAITESKNEFVAPRPVKITKIDSIEVQKDNLIQTKQCDFCPDSFENQENLTDHVISNHCKITCKVCDKQFPESLALKKHFTDEHAVTNVNCDKCEKEFSTKDLLSKHQKNGHSDTHNHNTSPVGDLDQNRPMKVIYRYPCMICYETYNTRQDLSTHICIKEGLRKNDKRPPLKCELCEEIFYSTSKFKKHFDWKHFSAMCNQFNQCEFCGIRFSNQHRLHFHLEGDNLPSPKKCDFCDRLCFPPCVKYVHMKKCEKRFEILYHCLGCNKEFNNKYIKRDHQKMCSHFIKAKYFQCKFCDKKFPSNFSCNQHTKRMHKDLVS